MYYYPSDHFIQGTEPRASRHKSHQHQGRLYSSIEYNIHMVAFSLLGTDSLLGRQVALGGKTGITTYVTGGIRTHVPSHYSRTHRPLDHRRHKYIINLSLVSNEYFTFIVDLI